ncbi:DUF3182 family protein [Xanthomonas translucens]|uniref:DUF3182 family protein n=1 Tax=Xanthomonas campestris pv. translucens TaxID=343 RepID=UPI0002A78B41|nr:DUF3182 family protein [Xanthomonas translucens]AKK66217.1 hypothetical protein FD63_01265 [Xanthomonas translucens pv. undulosa]AVY65046.1 hypothetical protein NZ30_01230 [Xanthomonas translucens pv. undulosa]ELQ11870.1 hypothetical protein A989_07323 [Xanthomonas translucens DAR61454]MBC3972729.1 DUF3182 family protein [Xanthomonas translucens pv. undulosa]MCT8270488.1 DUF3182 family protein [Xanthomonas translucens pv. undulosa]
MAPSAAHDHVRRCSVRLHPPGGHEAATHAWIAAEVARLMRLPLQDAGTVHSGFHVPDDTLTAAQALQLGVRAAADLLGGVVPHAFVATKAISHPLVDPGAAAPQGWNHALGGALGAATVPGYTAFSAADARVAYARLCGGGQVRLKLPHGIAGQGQLLLHDALALDTALDALAAADLAQQGVVLERQLDRSTTFSVGEVDCAGMTIAYYGTQSTTDDAAGRETYGGSKLFVIRGTLDGLLERTLPPQQREAVLKARHYDRCVAAAYPGFYASRRNYDVIDGITQDGTRLCGVLEQSWRIGGATPAELAAVAAFQRDPALHAVVAATVERYGAVALPADAEVYYTGEDPRVGRLTKYRYVSVAD